MLLKVLIVIILILLACVLSIIAINGIYRCYSHYIQTTTNTLSPNDGLLLVDLYASNIQSIPNQAISGMTVLIDLGIHNLDTGVYIIREKNMEPLKLKVPEVGEKYKISKGQFAGYIHTIRPSFIEIMPPNQIQIINDSSIQQIKKDTNRIIISDQLKMTSSLQFLDDQITTFRIFKIANLSSFSCFIHTIHSRYEIKPFFIGDMYISYLNNQIQVYFG